MDFHHPLEQKAAAAQAAVFGQTKPPIAVLVYISKKSIKRGQKQLLVHPFRTIRAAVGVFPHRWMVFPPCWQVGQRYNAVFIMIHSVKSECRNLLEFASVNA